jgi:hypothetical protein
MGGVFDDSPTISGGTDNSTIGNDGDALKVSSYQGGVWTFARSWFLGSGTDSVSAVQSGTWNIGSLTSITDPVAVTQSTSPWVISGTVTASEDKNFGTVGANTLRVAAQIGNATGEANFGAGNSSAQTLRVVVASNQAVIPVGGNVGSGATDSGNPVKIGAVHLTTQPTVTNNQRVNLQATNRGALIVSTGVDAFNINNITGTVPLPTGAATSALQTTGNTSLASIDTKLVQMALDYGASSGALRVASQIGNITGSADFGSGTTSAQTLRVVIPTDQTSIPVSQSGTWNIGTLTSITDPVTVNQGTSPWTISGTVTANAGSGTFAISAVSLPLPTGAATSALQTSGNASLSSIDTKLVQLALNYGASSGALRTASQIGNSSGAADFNFGTVGAQTLRSAAQIGNSTGAADFNAGNSSAQTLRVVVASNQVAIPVSQSTTPWIVSDALNSTGVQGAITVTSSSIEAKVGVSRLAGRKLLTVFNDGTATIWWGYTSGVTTSSGTPIFKGQQFNWNITDGLGIWLIAVSGSHNVRVTEAL